MTYMLCRNKVANYAQWKRGFDSHAPAHRAAGMKLLHLWREVGDRNNVFFLFEVASIKKATAFISTPQAARAAKDFGVIDGEYHFLTAMPTRRSAKSSSPSR